MKSSVPVVKVRRNKHNVGFDDEEFVFISKQANRLGLYPRQYLMQLVREDSHE